MKQISRFIASVVVILLFLVAVVAMILLFFSLPATVPTGAPPSLQVTITPTVFSYLPFVARDTPRALADFGCLTFQSDSDTWWLLRGGGMPRALTQGDWPVLSPDGHFIAFRRSFPTEIWLSDLDGSTETKLFVGKPVVYDMVWSPDGRMLAISNGGDIKRMPAGDLWRVDIPDGIVRQLADDNAGSPYFSPDGHWIAVVRTRWSPRTSVGIIRPDGKDHRVLFDYLVLQALEWAPDSSGFALALQRIEASDQQEVELWWVPTDGDPVRLGRLASAGSVQWQPGAERLLYIPVSQRAPLHLANRDGSGDVVVPGSEGMRMEGMSLQGGYRKMSSWSPDGRWILTYRERDFYLVDTHKLSTPQPLDVERVYGWLDAGHYLASYSGESYVDLYRCVPLGTCEFLAHVPGSWGVSPLSYEHDCGK